MVQLSHPYVTIGKTMALTMQTFVYKIMSVLFNMLPRFIIDILPRSKHLFSSKASIFQPSEFKIVQFSHSYMTTGKTIALTRQTFVSKVISPLLNTLSRFVIAFLPRSKHLLIT